MPMITEEMMSRGGMTADFSLVKRQADRLVKQIGKARKVHVTTPDGTDITFSVDGSTTLNPLSWWGSLRGGRAGTSLHPERVK